MTDIKLPLVATSDHPEFPVLAWSALELAEINRLMREAVRLNAQAVPDGYALVDREALDMAINALRRDANEGRPIRGEISNRLSAAPAAPQPEQAEPDWKRLYEHEKNRSAMWIAKYEKDIGPLEMAVPAAPQPAQPAQPAQPLTDEQIEAIYTQETGSLIDDSPWALVDFVRAIEQAHGIGVKT